MIARACLDCGAVIPRGPRCAACTSLLNVARGSSHQRGYTRRWRRISEVVRREHPWCSVPGCRQPATDADHVIPIRAGGRSIRANARPLCRLHHAQKTAADKELFP